MTQITTMPDLATLALSASLTLTCCPSFKPASPLPPPPPPPPGEDGGDSTQLDSVKTLVRHCSLEEVDGVEEEFEESEGNANSIRGLTQSKRGFNGTNSLEDHVQAWTSRRMALGAPKSRCFLPFLVGAKKMDECLACHSFIYPGEEVSCSVRGCEGVYHLPCAMEMPGVSNMKKFKCPQHECIFCKRKFHWRCTQCPIASHDGCSPWPDEVIHLVNHTGRAVCWRHPTNWRLAVKALADGMISLLNVQHLDPTSDMEEIFCRLPIPYDDEEFKIEFWKGTTDNTEEPPVPAPYIHIRRNMYLIKKKRSDDGVVGCTKNCKTECCEGCVCRVQSISCSRACHCYENCSNRPFRKEKKIKLVKTEFCGWGVEAAESINKGDFIVEYIGEVIDDALCEKRLWDMKYQGVQNFYMCEIRKDFTIDATFKGNLSRFLNHSCDPNCLLEKWQVEGETRVGVFAARSIEVGEPLTYDYRFVQFGPEVKCYCGAQNCQGYLGIKKKIVTRMNICWGAKRRRTSTRTLAIIAAL